MRLDRLQVRLDDWFDLVALLTADVREDLQGEKFKIFSYFISSFCFIEM